MGILQYGGMLIIQLIKTIFRSTIILFVFSTVGFCASVLVSGAGSLPVNGIYYEAGIYGGKPYYTNGTFYLSWNADSVWEICIEVGSPPPIYTSSGADLPASSWMSVLGSDPPPTLTLISSGNGNSIIIIDED